MNKLTSILLVAITLASCKPAAKETFVISGSVKNSADKELKLTIGTRVDTLKMNPDGTFSKEITLLKASDATLQGSKLYAPLYLIPGKDLAVTANGQDFNMDLAFAGKMAPENNFLLKRADGDSKRQELLFNYFKAPKTPADFKGVRDSLRVADLAFLENYSADGGKLDPGFVEHQKKVIEFGYYGDLNSYPMMAEYYNTDKPVIPDDWYAFMKDVKLDDPSLLEINEASFFISSYVTNQALKLSGVSRDKAYNNPVVIIATVNYLKENFKSPEFYNRFAFEEMKGKIDSEGPAGLEAVVEEYMTKSTDDANKKLLKDMVDGWAGMAPGKPAPVFNLPDINGKVVALADFAGKYVFIDFWATWCGPCKAEVPAYKKLIADYTGKNIVFMSISVDKDKAAWEKMVKEGLPETDPETGKPLVPAKMIAMDWLQLHDAVKYNKLWLVRYIPTFVLVDMQGNIVNARAERPSTEELRTVIDALPGI
jgi:thiol-disulfide isomerase/thioredoxin